jgi:hypothetical protein
MGVVDIQFAARVGYHQVFGVYDTIGVTDLVPSLAIHPDPLALVFVAGGPQTVIERETVPIPPSTRVPLLLCYGERSRALGIGERNGNHALRVFVAHDHVVGDGVGLLRIVLLDNILFPLYRRQVLEHLLIVVVERVIDEQLTKQIHDHPNHLPLDRIFWLFLREWSESWSALLVGLLYAPSFRKDSGGAVYILLPPELCAELEQMETTHLVPLHHTTVSAILRIRYLRRNAQSSLDLKTASIPYHRSYDWESTESSPSPGRITP